MVIHFHLFHFYIYPPHPQESGGTDTKGNELPEPAFRDAKILLSS